MAGLLAWLILFTWVAITIVATQAGYKSFKRRFQSKRGYFFGAMLGFIPTMGIWLTLMCWDYWRTTRAFNEMCQQAGVKIYVTPEKWKEMVGGEEAWKQLKWIDRFVSKNDTSVEREIVFNQKRYEISLQKNERIFTYTSDQFAPYTTLSDIMYYDILTKTVLFRYTIVLSGSPPSDWLVFWIPQRSCGDRQTSSNLYDEYFFRSKK